MVRRNSVLPGFCKPCLFLCSIQFAQLTSQIVQAKRKSRRNAAFPVRSPRFYLVIRASTVSIVGSFADEPNGRGNASSNAIFFIAFRAIIRFALIMTILKLHFYMENRSAKIACLVITSSRVSVSGSPIVQDKSSFRMKLIYKMYQGDKNTI